MSIDNPTTIAELMTKDMIEAEERAKAVIQSVLLTSTYCPECKAKRPLHLRNCHLRFVEVDYE